MYFWLICNHQNPEIPFQIFERDIYFKYYVNVLFNILQLCFVDNRMSKLCIMLCTELKKKKIKVFLPVDKPILKLVPVASFFKMKYSHEILTRLCVFIRHSNVYWCAKHLVTLRVWFNWAEQVFFFFFFLSNPLIIYKRIISSFWSLYVLNEVLHSSVDDSSLIWSHLRLNLQVE